MLHKILLFIPKYSHDFMSYRKKLAYRHIKLRKKMVKEIIYTIYESYIYYTVYRNNTMY